MSHKARKLLTQDTFQIVRRLVEMIPSKSILVIVGPETVESWELMEDPAREDLWDKEIDQRRNIGGEAIRQIDYAKWGWAESAFSNPRVMVIPHVPYIFQAIEKLELGGLTISVPKLCAFTHNGGWSDRFMRDVWGETRMSILAEHLRGGKVNHRDKFDWYLGKAIPIILDMLVETNAIENLERFEQGKPLTFILLPVYAQALAWAVAEVHRRTQKSFFGGVQDIVNQPFYGCDAILVTPRGVSIMRSGWEPSEFDRDRRARIRQRASL